jgi:hypothetical protein
VPRGTLVELQIAAPRRIVVPDLVRAPAGAAESLLSRLRLRVVRIDSTARFWQGGIVLRQEPAGGTVVSAQSEVRLWAGKADLTGVLLALGGLVAAGAGALWLKVRRPPRSSGPVKRPLVGLRPHAVAGGQTIDAPGGSIVHEELDLRAHAAAGTQVIEGDGPLEGDSP